MISKPVNELSRLFVYSLNTETSLLFWNAASSCDDTVRMEQSSDSGDRMSGQEVIADFEDNVNFSPPQAPTVVENAPILPNDSPDSARLSADRPSEPVVHAGPAVQDEHHGGDSAVLPVPPQSEQHEAPPHQQQSADDSPNSARLSADQPSEPVVRAEPAVQVEHQEGDSVDLPTRPQSEQHLAPPHEQQPSDDSPFSAHLSTEQKSTEQQEGVVPLPDQEDSDHSPNSARLSADQPSEPVVHAGPAVQVEQQGGDSVHLPVRPQSEQHVAPPHQQQPADDSPNSARLSADQPSEPVVHAGPAVQVEQQGGDSVHLPTRPQSEQHLAPSDDSPISARLSTEQQSTEEPSGPVVRAGPSMQVDDQEHVVQSEHHGGQSVEANIHPSHLQTVSPQRVSVPVGPDHSPAVQADLRAATGSRNETPCLSRRQRRLHRSGTTDNLPCPLNAVASSHHDARAGTEPPPHVSSSDIVERQNQESRRLSEIIRGSVPRTSTNPNAMDLDVHQSPDRIVHGDGELQIAGNHNSQRFVVEVCLRKIANA